MAESTLSTWVERGRGKAEGLYSEVYRLSAVNSTPVIAGGPDGNTVHRIGGQLEWWGIRPTAVRGVWRWWIRALLAGLLWEEGYTCDYERLVRLEEKLGLGSTAEASKVFLRVKSKINGRPSTNTNSGIISKLRYIPRYKLLTIGSRNYSQILLNKQPIPPGHVSLDITLYSRDRVFTKPYEDLYKYALWLALALSGIGQMTSRGFGKFSLKGPWDEEISQIKITQILNNIRDTIERININIEEIRGCQKISRDTDLPLTPTFHEKTLRIVLLSDVKNIRVEGCIECRGTCHNIWQVLQSIGYATMKNAWKACEKGKLKIEGGKYHTWPLGLPRKGERRDWNTKKIDIYVNNKKVNSVNYNPRIKIPTGYLFEAIEKIEKNKEYKIGRLQSLIRFTPIVKDNGGFDVLIYGFLTSDLEFLLKNLYHYGYHEARTRRENGLLEIKSVTKYASGRSAKDLFDEALDYIEKLLECSNNCVTCR